jgi:hypothetical protein
MTKTVTKVVASVAVLVALVFGASALAGSGSDNTTATAAAPGTGGVPQGGGAMPQGAVPQGGGAVPQGGPPQGGPPPGMFAPVTGAAAAKVKATVLARYPGGRIERIFKLPDGRYAAHVFTNATTEVHVLISKDFKVVGTEQDGFGHRDGGRFGPGGEHVRPGGRYGAPRLPTPGNAPSEVAPSGTSKS